MLLSNKALNICINYKYELVGKKLYMEFPIFKKSNSSFKLIKKQSDLELAIISNN